MINKKCYLKANKSGLSIIEIMLAVILLGIMIGPIFVTLFQSQKVIRVGAHDLETMNLASSFIFQINRMNPESIAVTDSPQSVLPDAYGFVRIDTIGDAPVLKMPQWDKDTFQLFYTAQRLDLFDYEDGTAKQAMVVVVKVNRTAYGKEEQKVEIPTLLIY